MAHQGSYYEADAGCRGADQYTQTTFIPGRYILEGVITLHENLHELRVKKMPGIILKLDFEKSL
jgi:hypothetical protein